MKLNMKRSVAVVSVAIVAALLAVTSTLYSTSDSKEKPIVEVEMPDLDAHHDEGKSLYVANCSGCHGTTLGGRKGVAPPLVHGYYKPSHHSDIAFYRAIANGVTAHHWQFGDMPAVASIDKAQATKIIRYIRAVQRENGIGD